jgi:hypothetical protein
MKNLLLATAALITLFGLSGCETSSDEQAASAQSCIDSATTGTQAAKCMTLVAGRVDAQASQINCSALFLEWGFSTNHFASLMQTLQNNSNGQNAALNLLAGLPLSGNNPVSGTSSAVDVLNISSACQASLSPGLTMLSQYLVIATSVSNLGVAVTNGQMDVNAAKAALAGMSAGSPQAIAIGQAAVTVYSSYCGSGTSTSTVCAAITKAVGGNVTAGSIAVALATYLQSP